MGFLTFYKEWLPLPKAQFRLLAFLAENGKFSGNKAQLCRMLGLSPRGKNVKSLGATIEALANSEFIKAQRRGNTYLLEVAPQETEVKIYDKAYAEIKEDLLSPKNVSLEAVIKTLMWIGCANGNEIYTENFVGGDIGCCDETVSKAYKILVNLNLVSKTIIKEQFDGGDTINVGHEVCLNALKMAIEK